MSTGTIARNILADWANQQDSWIRSLVVNVLAQGRDLGSEEVGEAFQSLLLEKHLANGEFTPTLPIDWTGADSGQLGDLQLLYIKDVQGVNALASDQEITFGPSLTLVYGENAAGKSGYVRILKRVAAVRNAEDVLPDVSLLQSAPAVAALGYRLRDKESEYRWRGEAGVDPFTRLTIFDTRAVALHVDDDLTYHYTPADLALFKYTHKAIDAVRVLLEAEHRRRQPTGDPIVGSFQRGTSVYPLVESLGPSTDLHRLEQLATLSPEEVSELASLRIQVPSLSATLGQDRVVLAESQLNLLRSIYNAAQQVTTYDFTTYEERRVSLHAARAAQQRAAAELFADVADSDPNSEVQISFISAGEQYIQHLRRGDYPHDGDDCIYCRQQLSTQAATLVRNYRSYVSNAAAQQVQVAEHSLAATIARLQAVPVNGIAVKLQILLPTFDAQPEVRTALDGALQLLRSIESIQKAILNTEELDTGPLLASIDILLPTIIGHSRALANAVTVLKAGTADRDKLLRQSRGRVAELEARQQLQILMPEIRVHVRDAKWVQSASMFSRQFTSILRGLTEASKKASEELLNHDFEERFQKECAALRAPVVKLNFPGRRGVPSRRKSLSEQHKPSAILSEGEQKVIALADFLAEASLRAAAVPVVFDDPVNSLDYRRLNEVVDRLYELSGATQVIVFTHSILLAAGLLSRFDRSGDRHRCRFYEMSAEPQRKGIVTAADHPRTDTPEHTARDIKELIRQTERIVGTAQRPLLEHGYDLIRNWIESFIEKQLFGDVVQRYNPHIGVTRLDQVRVDRLSEAFAVIVPIYEKACRYIRAHSQPTEVLGIAPTLEELRQDWFALEATHRRYRAD